MRFIVSRRWITVTYRIECKRFDHCRNLPSATFPVLSGLVWLMWKIRICHCLAVVLRGRCWARSWTKNVYYNNTKIQWITFLSCVTRVLWIIVNGLGYTYLVVPTTAKCNFTRGIYSYVFVRSISCCMII
jgi:hypothetical protein